MANSILLIKAERITSEGEVELLLFDKGINLITGEHGAGKTTWIKHIDFVLGKDSNISHVFPDDELSTKYAKLSIDCLIGEDLVHIHRLPLEHGVASKIFINDIPYSPSEFSTEILRLLNIPSDIKYPKGNPYTTPWVTLTFRSIFRHIYRKEDSWNDITEKQPQNEQFASISLLLGYADKIFPNELNNSISNEKKLLELQNKRDQFNDIIFSIAREMSSKENSLINKKSSLEINNIIEHLQSELKKIEVDRETILKSRLERLDNENKFKEIGLSETRAILYSEKSKNIENASTLRKKINEFQIIKQSISDELGRLKRTKKSGLISELKITHCPACDQEFEKTYATKDECFVCHRSIHGISTKKSTRIDFEIEQLTGELTEISSILMQDQKALNNYKDNDEVLGETILAIDTQLESLKSQLFALNDNQISDLDVQKGRIIEQIINYERLDKNRSYKTLLEQEIIDLEFEILKEKAILEKKEALIDFETIPHELAYYMQDYVDKVSKGNPNIWKNKGRINILMNESKISFFVNNKNWTALGGLDRYIFLLSYQYGLLALSYNAECNYPALTIIDLPPDLGRSKETSFNYLITPFTSLSNAMLTSGSGIQIIVLGRSFTGIKNANTIPIARQ
ncbi:hypothetical protein ACFSC6_11085 [Rufibacter sediminis]|uniref:Rad50/SbcC-type AAA domain-containing protein n=1 Tax=Rufibacter sediminis TaxID=2762756 RepID=A0ABR6VTA1_9BACT|nr:hypothetical protein [Rufibacter sediminis]MBC3540425.1 hypothetical protein [Rufibacter sediminis]